VDVAVGADTAIYFILSFEKILGLLSETLFKCQQLVALSFEIRPNDIHQPFSQPQWQFA
jgi:hypothetical protein